MSMYLVRRISEGLGAWLHYEFCCDRSELFSERYMAAPLGSILSSASEGRVHAEFTHPILASTMTGSGRRPAIDFVISEKYPTPKIAIETKWVGDDGLSISSIVWDMIRLSLLELEFGADCYFVLGGQRKALKKLFARDDFMGKNGDNAARPILKTDTNNRCRLNLVPSDHWRTPLLRECLVGWPEKLPAPQRIISCRSEPFPVNPPLSRYQVYAWKITHAKAEGSFLPAENKYYK